MSNMVSLWFRSVLSDICLNVTTIQALVLDYLVALYPFLLILISYFIIELHDRKFVCIVTVWKPLQKLLTIFHVLRCSHISHRLICYILLLVHVKVLSVTMDLLTATQIHKLGSNTSMFGVYYSTSVHYFGDEHLPYAILALIIFILLA